MARADPATQSNYLSIRTTSLHLEWDIDWTARTICGHVEHVLEAQHDDVQEAIFDSSYLVITGATGSDGVSLPYKLDDRHPVMGNALHVHLPTPLKKGQSTSVRIEYASTDKCTALGWLEANQTASGNHPFLYSQCQAIHMRSLAPCMDTPAVKATYTSTVTSYLPVLMSALRVSPPSEEVLAISHDKEVTYKYRQPVAIPSYLIAIAAGEVAYKRVGKRTGVWADPKTLPKAVYEFEEDMEKFLTVAETILPPYAWGDYDVLVLPPSFPFGGMENANLTFLTPTLLAGDRSLVDVIAHELSHSWAGNNVGCKDWGSFFLNESWTTYLERLLVRHDQGEPGRGFSYILGYKALQDSLAAYEKSGETRYQRLVVPYAFGEDPDDGFSTVPYDKGANLLLHLEGLVGGLDVFLPYVKEYFITFAGKSIGAFDWQAHLFEYFGKHKDAATILPKLKNEVDWDAWFNGEGLTLPVKPKYDTTLADAAYALAERWEGARKSSSATDGLKQFKASDLDKFSSSQTVVFLETLEQYDALPAEYLQRMNELYSLDTTENAEIRLRWYNVALKGDGRDFKASAAKWVVTVGRMKMCRPITKALFKCDPDLAVKTFLAAESFYHPIARNQLRKDLKLPAATQ